MDVDGHASVGGVLLAATDASRLGWTERSKRSVGAMSDMRLPVRIGDDAAVLDLVPLASDMPTVEDLRMVLAAYRIRGMLGFRSRRAEVARIRREVTGAVHSVQPRTVVMVFEVLTAPHGDVWTANPRLRADSGYSLQRLIKTSRRLRTTLVK